MNFSQFTTQFAGIPVNSVNQFTSAKFGQNLTTTHGQQLVSFVSSNEGGIHYLRPADGNTIFSGQVPPSGNTNIGEPPQALITLPITMPGNKPGDAQQTVHIQVINPNPVQQPTQKFQMGQMQIPIQSFQPGGTTVLTVAYSPQEGKFIPNHGFPEGMTVVAALQPQDLQLLAQAQAANVAHITSGNQQNSNEENTEAENKSSNSDTITIKEEPNDWDSSSLSQPQLDYSDYLAQSTLPVNLQPFLKLNHNVIKFEPGIAATRPKLEDSTFSETLDDSTKSKKKRKSKKKTPKPKPPKPGQVLIATAIDGTTLFCCPECQMAYPEKENLEQHLTVHKIERRYICDICGAGLKRKEHLERHKSGHNPDRPYICSVCMKGFKRKEHLNLHFVIHSGEKNEICLECGKGFYRKDHLRKHTNSHAAKRLKEEMNARIKEEKFSTSLNGPQSNQEELCPSNNDNISDTSSQIMQINTEAAISLSTVYVPTSNNTTVPVQIQIPQLSSCSNDLSANSVGMSDTDSQSQLSTVTTQ